MSILREFDIFTTETENSINPLTHLKVYDNVVSKPKDHVPAPVPAPKVNVKQNGGNLNKNVSNNDVNKLVSMITSESSTSININTNTEELETQLDHLLKKIGGRNTNTQSGGTAQSGGAEYNNIKSFFNNLKKDGIKVDIKLNDVSMSEFFDNTVSLSVTDPRDMTTLKGGGKKPDDYSATSSAMPMRGGGKKPDDYSATSSVMSMRGGGKKPDENNDDYSATSSAMPYMRGGSKKPDENNDDYSATSSIMQNMNGGSNELSESSPFMKMINSSSGSGFMAFQKVSNNSSVPDFMKGGNHNQLVSESSELSSLLSFASEQHGGAGDGLKPFLELKTFVATKLKIPNSVKAAKIAGEVQRDVKKSQPELKGFDLTKESKKHFEKNMTKYEKMK